jgi:phosphatidylserine/phosphatidylglycerophosphate/cardiolipin synthase-like enzyme
VSQYQKTLVDKKTTPRMPWHDVTLGVVGPIARDIARHFIQRWNFLKSTKSMHRHIVPFLLPKGEYVAARDESNFSGTCKVQLLRSSSRWSSDVEREVLLHE